MTSLNLFNALTLKQKIHALPFDIQQLILEETKYLRMKQDVIDQLNLMIKLSRYGKEDAYNTDESSNGNWGEYNQPLSYCSYMRSCASKISFVSLLSGDDGFSTNDSIYATWCDKTLIQLNTDFDSNDLVEEDYEGSEFCEDIYGDLSKEDYPKHNYYCRRARGIQTLNEGHQIYSSRYQFVIVEDVEFDDEGVGYETKEYVFKDWDMNEGYMYYDRVSLFPLGGWGVEI